MLQSGQAMAATMACDALPAMECTTMGFVATDTDNRLLEGPQLEAWEALVHAFGLMSRALDMEVQHVHDISLREYEVLLKLFHAPGHELTMTDLGARVNLTQSGISRSVGGLEKRGFVRRRRCGDDGRVWWAQLTDAGLAKLHEARATHHDRVRSMFSAHLSEDEAKQMSSVLGRILEHEDPCEVAREVMGEDASC